MDTNPAGDRSPGADAPAAPDATPAAAAAFAVDPARLARLFRHTVRVGGVNPLLHLMPRLRKAGSP